MFAKKFGVWGQDWLVCGSFSSNEARLHLLADIIMLERQEEPVLVHSDCEFSPRKSDTKLLLKHSEQTGYSFT